MTEPKTENRCAKCLGYKRPDEPCQLCGETKNKLVKKPRPHHISDYVPTKGKPWR